jgi:HTH-type transcriptional regulator, sugar sensing transcriptional regulator
VGKGENMHDDIMILKGLVDLGFSERQSKVYLALCKKSNASLSDLQKITGIRQDKLGEIINNLVREGYCSEKKSDHNRKCFNITNPKTAISNSVEKKIKSLENSYNALEEIYNNTEDLKEPFEYIEVFYGKRNIHQQYCNLLSNSENEMLSFTKPPWADVEPEEIKEQADLAKNFLDHGGVLKTIYEIASMDEDFTIGIMERDLKIGEQSRISMELPIKMFIFDRKSLLIADLSPFSPTNDFRMVLIKQQTIVNAFIALFDFFWQQSMDSKSWKIQQNK